MVTIKDIARLTGLSIGTISNYVNGKPVKKANEDKIRKAIEETGYKPNFFGKSLKSKETKTVGVVAYNIATRFVSEVYNVLEKRLAESGYDMYFCNTHGDLNSERDKLEFLSNHGADAIVLFPKSYEHSSISVARAAGIPTVVVDNIIRDEPCSSIVFDDESSAYTATRHLIRNGHTKIACLAGYDDYYTTITRISGYKRALADSGITDSYIASGLVTHAEHTNATIAMLEKNPDITAFVITSSALLIGFLAGLKALQFTVPDDISYITFDDTEYYDILTATPTYVYQDKERLGNSIFEVLTQLLADKDQIIRQRIPTHLIFGSSVKNLLGSTKSLSSF